MGDKYGMLCLVGTSCASCGGLTGRWKHMELYAIWSSRWKHGAICYMEQKVGVGDVLLS